MCQSIPFKRKLVQLYAALLYNAHLKGFVDGEIYTGNTKVLCVPGLNCYSCPGAVGACPLGALQNAIASTKQRPGFYVIGILMLFGLLLGRTICGWLCPFGWIQELLHKVPTPKIRKNRITHGLSYLKYGILVVFVFLITFWYGLQGVTVPAFCKYICPAGTLEGAVGLLGHPQNSDLFSMLGALFTNKIVILLLTGLTCVFCYRAFCRFLCPLGAIYSLFCRVALIGVKVDTTKCSGCGACVRNCPMDIRRVGDHECIHCAKCVGICPEKAIHLQCGHAVLLGPERTQDGKAKKREKILGAIAIFVLAWALLWYQILAPRLQKRATTSDTPIMVTTAPMETAGRMLEAAQSTPGPEKNVVYGHAVGEVLPDFTVELMDGTSFVLSEHRGQVVMINLWATYCGPCVNELPLFSALKDAHPDMEVLAVHANLVTEDVEAYLEDKDWHVMFAMDTDDEALFEMVGGSTLLPQTLVIAPNGVVIYNQAGSVTDVQLEELYAQAENDR